jgi:peptide-methionine (R)-S-oxide reductase
MQRRTLLKILAAAPFTAATRGVLAAPPAGMDGIAELQKNWRSFLPPGARIPQPTEALRLSKEEWKRRLSPAAYKVLREEGTERAGTSPLDDEKRPGVFACAGCDLPLFTSAMKYDSGTGWPSFFTTIPGVFGTKKDYFLIFPRTEYHCVRCGGHHGHVFDDGPPPTRERWCNNGVALRFLPRDAA